MAILHEALMVHVIHKRGGLKLGWIKNSQELLQKYI